MIWQQMSSANARTQDYECTIRKVIRRNQALDASVLISTTFRELRSKSFLRIPYIRNIYPRPSVRLYLIYIDIDISI